MWSRIRFDISWSDLYQAAVSCFRIGRWSPLAEEAIRCWSEDRECLITLSVRSSFDLALRALRFPVGSEVLLSAWTVPGMVEIVHRHGLVPVPVDVDENGTVQLPSLRRCISLKSRMVVVPPVDDERVPIQAQFAWNHIVFLPFYPELSNDAVDQFAGLLRPISQPAK